VTDRTEGLPTWLEVDLKAIAGNVKQMRRLTGVDVMAVVKANGYGHGLVPVAREAVEAGAAYCGVARIDEALEFRAAGLSDPILVLGHTPSGRYHQAIEAGITLTVFRRSHLEALRAAASESTRPAVVHLKVDTGMSRLGAPPASAFGMLQELNQMPGVTLEGLFTHFARADEPRVATTEHQDRVFRELVEEVESAGLRPPLVHAANSAAALTRPSSRYDMVRPGIALYGMDPSAEVRLPSGFQRAITWKARITQIRDLPPGTGVSYGHAYVTTGDERIGVVPVGYGDGYRREDGNRVLVRGRQVPVRGRVCMDQLMIDLTDLPSVEVGEEVVLLGQQGRSLIRASDLAATWGTLNYEVTCGLSARVPRLYDGEWPSSASLDFPPRAT
jgi:alanine racemase